MCLTLTWEEGGLACHIPMQQMDVNSVQPLLPPLFKQAGREWRCAVTRQRSKLSTRSCCVEEYCLYTAVREPWLAK